MFRGTPRKDTSAHGAWSTVGAFSLMEAAKSAESPKAQAIATKERSPTHSSVPTAQRRAPIAKDCASNRTEHRAIPRHPENRWEPAMRATQIRGAMGNEGQPPATLHSKGCADVAIGVERLAKELPDLAFVPRKPNGSTSPSRRTNAPHRLCGRFARLRKASPSTARSTQSRATKRRTRGPSSTRARRTTRVAGCGRGDTLLRCPHLSIGFPYSNCINSCISRFPSA